MELAEVEAFLDAASRESSAPALEGEAGIGKTTAWREARRQAEDRGVRVLWCRPSGAEAKFSFAGVADLLSTVPESAWTALAEPQREALEVALLHTTPSGRGSRSQGGCGWIPGAGSGARRRRAASARGRRHSLTAVRLGRLLSRPLLVRIRQASRGNPFYALEIARLAESSVDSFTTELIADRAWRTHDQAELAIVEWVGWFNHQRLRSSLGDNPPTEYEHQWALAQLPTAEPRTQAAILA